MIKKKDLIIGVLKSDKEGLTLAEIARKLHISRNTIAIVLAELRGTGLIKVRPVGIAKLHYWRGKKNG